MLLYSKNIYFPKQIKREGYLELEDGIIKNFYKELITGLGFRNARIAENFEEEGYFALLSQRTNEFPKQLRFTNKSVIDYLINW